MPHSRALKPRARVPFARAMTPSSAFSLALALCLTSCAAEVATKVPHAGQVRSSGRCGIASGGPGATELYGNEIASKESRVEATARIDAGRLMSVTVLVRRPHDGAASSLLRGSAAPRVDLKVGEWVPLAVTMAPLDESAPLTPDRPAQSNAVLGFRVLGEEAEITLSGEPTAHGTCEWRRVDED